MGCALCVGLSLGTPARKRRRRGKDILMLMGGISVNSRVVRISISRNTNLTPMLFAGTFWRANANSVIIVDISMGLLRSRKMMATFRPIFPIPTLRPFPSQFQFIKWIKEMGVRTG